MFELFKSCKHELLIWRNSVYELILNDIIPMILCRHIRYFMYTRLFKAKIGKDVYMYRCLELRSPQNLVVVGKIQSANMLCSMHVRIAYRRRMRNSQSCINWTLHHDYNSDDFMLLVLP